MVTCTNGGDNPTPNRPVNPVLGAGARTYRRGMATQALPGPPAAPRLPVGRSAGYVLIGFPLAIATFVLLVAGFAVGIGTLAITIGIVVLAGTLSAARGLARVERSRLDALLGIRTPRPAYRTPRGGRLGRAVSAGADPRRWLDLLHGIVAFPVAVATFAIVVSWFAVAAGGLGYVLWQWSLPRDPDRHTLAYYVGLGTSDTADILLMTGIGAVAALALPWVVRGCAALRAGLAWALLADHGDD